MWVRISADAGRRVGVVVSKRNFRRAVDRNRAKRLLREAFRLQRVNLTVDADVILSAKRAMAGLHRQEVEQDFERLCRRAGIWRA
jgi:ribonuclease P protein component